MLKRTVFRSIGVGVVTFSLLYMWMAPEAFGQLPRGTLDPTSIDKYVQPLVIPPPMPQTDKKKALDIRPGYPKWLYLLSLLVTDYYELAVWQFDQQILPPGMPMTTVWSSVSPDHPWTTNYPAFTIEARWLKPVRVKWINDLVDASGNYLSHLVPVDQTLHWANPPGGLMGRDTRGTDPTNYTGPVPIVTHVHGAHAFEESDGYPEAWYLPKAANIPAGYATVGTYYDQNKAQFEKRIGQVWRPGTSVFQYFNDQRATTLWYHDHALGLTRTNVQAGPAGFYLLRGGPDDVVKDLSRRRAILPGPAPAAGDPPGMAYHEIPIAIQDRSFNEDGSLFYPDNRAFFEGLNTPLTVPYLDIPFIPDPAVGGPSDVSPIWNPEYFGNTIVVNGHTWPYLEVEQSRYRFRFLNGCSSRFLILQFDTPVPLWQIGTEGGFLPAPVDLNAAYSGMMLMGLAERADVIVDFGGLDVGTTVTLLNLGPDEPFGGGMPFIDFTPADPGTTGQVMEFRVIAAARPDPTTPPEQLVLPRLPVLPAATATRQVSLNEEVSQTVFVTEDDDGNLVFDDTSTEPFGPTAAKLGTVDLVSMPGMPMGMPMMWMDDITENPACGATEVWEIYNFTMDAHPIHVHLVMFQVINREGMPMMPMAGMVRGPEAWESGYKDTVIAYPGEITRIKAKFDLPGRYVWHCHIIEHEDNEMMRSYYVGPMPAMPMP